MKLDAYDIRSRYQPGLLAVAPVAVAVIGFGLSEAAWVAALTGLALAVGLPFFLAGVVRSAGLRLQDRLYRSWGGPSTRRLLRHSGADASAADRSRWHTNLSKLSGVALPAAGEELNDPANADETYDSVTAVARGHPRRGLPAGGRREPELWILAEHARAPAGGTDPGDRRRDRPAGGGGVSGGRRRPRPNRRSDCRNGFRARPGRTVVARPDRDPGQGGGRQVRPPAVQCRPQLMTTAECPSADCVLRDCHTPRDTGRTPT